MKIRTQFVLMITGVLLIPLLIAGLWWAVTTYLREVNNPLPQYNQLSVSAEQSVDAATWNAMRQNTPQDGDFVVMNKSNQVIFSSISRYQVDQYWSPSDLIDLMKEKKPFLFFYGPPDKPSFHGLCVLFFPSEFKAPVNFFQVFMIFIGTILIVLLLFTLTFAILVAKSNIRAIMKLEKATKEVARGNFDHPIQAGGNDEIKSLVQSFENMRMALKEEDARQSRFVMGISHDLKSPLALIRGYVELLRDGLNAGPDEREKYFSIVLDKAETLDSMIDELIDYVKMDTGEWKEKLQKVAFSRFLGDLGRRFDLDARLQKRNFVWESNLPVDLTVEMEEKAVRRCLENLVYNAFRYSSEGNTVWMTADLQGGALELTIRDNGPGIDPKDLPHLFEHFYRGSPSRREAGMGLGLAIVRSIVESHGWTIQARSDGGAWFIIRIPL